MYSEEHIIAYLRGDLADEELFAFEEALKTDTNLATSFAFMSDAQLAEDIWGDAGVMQSLEEVWQEMPYAQQDNLESESTQTSKNIFRSIPKKYTIIIGTVSVLLIATILYLMSNKSLNIFSDTQSQTESKEENDINISDIQEDNDNSQLNDLEEIKKRIEEIKQKEEEIEKIKQNIGKPKNEQEKRYLKKLKKQQKIYQKQRISIYDQMIAIVNSEVILPKVDTLIYDDVVFSWNKKYQNEDLELEVFTKETQARPNRIEIKAGKVTHKQKLSNNFYYWRLKVKHGKTIGLGRFYVNRKENIVENNSASTIAIPEINFKRYQLNKELESQIRTHTKSPVENFHIIFPRDGEILETSVERIEDKHIFLTFFEWFGNVKTGRYKVEIFKGQNKKPLLDEEFPVDFFTKNKLTQFPVKVRLGLFTPDLYYLRLHHNDKLLYTGRFVVK